MTWVARPLTIYALAHPTTGEIRYVGATEVSPAKRLRTHISDARREWREHGREKMNDRCRWILDLVDAETPPKVIVLEENAIQFQSVSERRWVHKMLAEGKQLFNRFLVGEPNP